MSSIIPRFEFVMQAGNFIIRPLELALNWLRANFKEGEHGYITFTKITHQRTAKQNRYFHGPLLSWFSAQSGHTNDEMKEILKNMYGPKRRYTFKNGTQTVINKSSADWTTQEMTHVIESARVLASEMGWGEIPEPEQVHLEE